MLNVRHVQMKISFMPSIVIPYTQMSYYCQDFSTVKSRDNRSRNSDISRVNDNSLADQIFTVNYCRNSRNNDISRENDMNVADRQVSLSRDSTVFVIWLWCPLLMARMTNDSKDTYTNTWSSCIRRVLAITQKPPLHGRHMRTTGWGRVWSRAHTTMSRHLSHTKAARKSSGGWEA